MEREIIFKVYYELEGEVLAHTMQLNKTDKRVWFPSIQTNGKIIAVCEYTGLTDKNGTKIFEGDIIKNHQAPENIVHWYVDSWCYQNFHAESLPLGDLCNPYDNALKGLPENYSGHEVIGNIHDKTTTDEN